MFLVVVVVVTSALCSDEVDQCCEFAFPLLVTTHFQMVKPLMA